MSEPIGQIVFGILSGNPAVIALAGTRIFPAKMPQGCRYPAAVYSVVSDVETQSLAGYTASQRNARVQIDAYSPAYLEAQALADAISAALTKTEPPALSSRRVLRRDLYEDETELHRVSMDFSLWVED